MFTLFSDENEFVTIGERPEYQLGRKVTVDGKEYRVTRTEITGSLADGRCLVHVTFRQE